MTGLAGVVLLALEAQAASPACPVLRFPETPAALSQQCASVQGRALDRLRALLALKPEARTFANTVSELDGLLVDLEEESSPLTVLRSLAPSFPLRLAAGECHASVAALSAEVLSSPRVCAALAEARQGAEPSSPEDRRLVDRLLLECRRHGANLPAEDRTALRGILGQLESAEREYLRNHVDSDDFALFEKAELEGVPAGTLRLFEAGPDGKVRVPLTNAAYDAVASTCRNPDARRRLEFAFNNRTYPANVAVQDRIFGLRRRMALLLGYDSYARLKTQDRMAKNPEAVSAFVERVGRAVSPGAARHAQALASLKAAEEPAGGGLRAWDVRYYERRLKARSGLPDDGAISEYLPLEGVLGRALALSGRVFGVRTREVRPARAWHAEVRLFEVSDAGTGALLGRFYLDLHARPGKAKTTPDYSLMGSRAGSGQRCRVAAAVFAMNLSRPAHGGGRLKHADLAALLHGLGHMLQQILSAPRHAGFSGPRVAQDFSDVTAKLLEGWAWDPKALRRLSGRAMDGRPLPEGLAAAVARSRTEFTSLRHAAWAAQAAFDLEAHSRELSDASERYRALFDEVSPVPQTPGTHPQLKFAIVKGGGFGAYVSRWSEAVAADALSRFAASKGGALDASVGGEFRRLVLEPGGSRDPADLLRAFLGRAPDERAFLEGLADDAPALVP